jgi:hypothetical protein
VVLCGRSGAAGHRRGDSGRARPAPSQPGSPRRLASQWMRSHPPAPLDPAGSFPVGRQVLTLLRDAPILTLSPRTCDAAQGIELWSAAPQWVERPGSMR